MKQLITIAVVIALTLTLTCAVRAQEQWVEAGKFGNVPGQPCYTDQNAGGVPPISGHVFDTPQGGQRPIVVRRTAAAPTNGLNGQNGANGVNGANGISGRNGHHGRTGQAGRTGRAGQTGRSGRDGRDGRDGAAIVIPTTTPAGDGGSNKEGGNAMPWILGIIAIIVVGGVVGWLVSVTQAAKTEIAKAGVAAGANNILLATANAVATTYIPASGRRVTMGGVFFPNGGGVINGSSDETAVPINTANANARVAVAQAQRPAAPIQQGMTAADLIAVLNALPKQKRPKVTVNVP